MSNDQSGVQALGPVRAKMTCSVVEQFASRQKVKLGAVYSQQGENSEFAEATPSGECWMQISGGRPAAGFFKPGKNYYVTFTEAP